MDDLEKFLEECERLIEMTRTEGWKILERKLKEEELAQLRALSEIPMLPENFNQLTLAQAQVKGIRYVFDMLDNYIQSKEQVLKEQE